MKLDPLISAAALLLTALADAIGSWWFITMFCLTWLTWIFSADRVGGWFEAIGLKGVIDAFGSIWSYWRTGKPEEARVVYLSPPPYPNGQNAQPVAPAPRPPAVIMPEELRRSDTPLP